MALAWVPGVVRVGEQFANARVVGPAFEALFEYFHSGVITLLARVVGGNGEVETWFFGEFLERRRGGLVERFRVFLLLIDRAKPQIRVDLRRPRLNALTEEDTSLTEIALFQCFQTEVAGIGRGPPKSRHNEQKPHERDSASHSNLF
jgi:hypothetical protein